MSNHIIYTIDYNELPYLCTTSICALLDQTSPAKVIASFRQPTQKDIYQHYFSHHIHNSQLNFICSQNNNISLHTLYEKYISQYDWFIFLSPYILYYNNFTEDLMSLCDRHKDLENFYVVPHNASKDTEFKILVCHKKGIIDFIRQQFSLKHIFEYFTVKENMTNILSFSCSSWKDSEDEYLFKQNTYHDDQDCTFAKFISLTDKEIKDSFVYINKHNFRVYNISNNLIGFVDSYDNNQISIIWQTDTDDKEMKYRFDYGHKIYVHG